VERAQLGLRLAVVNPAARLQRRFFDRRLEPFLVTGGLYAFTALCYTRLLPLQSLGLLLLVVVVHWIPAIRRTGLTWRDLKLTTRRL
jgi:hypothetical protein